MAAASKMEELEPNFKSESSSEPEPEPDYDLLAERFLDIRRWSIYNSDIDNYGEPGADGFGGLGSGPYQNTLAATIAAVASTRFVNAAGPEEEPPEVSRWSSSSSSTEEAVTDDDNNDNLTDGSKGSPKSQSQSKDQNEMIQETAKTGETESAEEIKLTENKSKRDSKSAKQKQKQKKTQDRTSEEEVIYDLDERAMSELPDHLQHNMREVQRERFERLRRDNISIPVRKHSDYRVTCGGERWCKSLIQRFPTTSSRSALRSSRDTNYTQTRTCHSEDQEEPDIIRPVRTGDIHEEYYEDKTGEYCSNYPGSYKRVGRARGRRRHRAASIKDAPGYSSGGGGHLDEGPRRSEPCLSLPYIKSMTQSSTAGYTKIYTGDQQQQQQKTREAQNQEQGQAAHEASQIQKKRSFLHPGGLRARVKKSIYKLSMVFKKG